MYVVCCIFVFPETMSHSYLSLVSILLGDLKSYTEAIGSILDLLPSEIADNKDGLVSQCASKRVGLYSKIGERKCVVIISPFNVTNYCTSGAEKWVD